ncbi:MAG: protein kinase [Myxococcota bacterium]
MQGLKLPDGDAIDALRDTLAAQGVNEDHATTETLGRGQALSMTATLPPARISGDAPADFVVREELGRGGMGIVELAQQRALRRDVAVKRLWDPTPELVETLLHEAMVTGQLEHPNIVPVHAVVADDEGRGPAVIMKRITGTEWLSLIEEGETSLEDHLQTFLQVCNAVAFAHSRRVIHRDIKPANVMLGAFGEVYLVDWGVALPVDAESSERIAGTPAYIAPEMIDGTFDERSDVFLLGATLHEVVTGEARHPGTKLLRVLRAAQAAKPFRYDAEVPRELGEICNRACAKDPDERYDSVAALQEAVRIFLRHRAITSLVEAGRERLEELQRLLEGEPEYVQTQALFSAARFAFEQALEGWPESPEASQGREATLQLMVDYELKLGHADVAIALVDAMANPPCELRQRAVTLRGELNEKRERLAQLERDHDQNFGAPERSRAIIGFAVATILLTSGFVSLRVLYPSYAPPALRFSIVSVAVFLTVAGIVRWWSQRSPFNLVNRRIAQITLLCLGASMLNRFSALIAGADTPDILRTDALILGIGGLAFIPFHKSGPWLAALSFGVAFAGSLRPTLFEPMFIGLAVVIPVVFMLVRRYSQRPSSDS